MVEARGAPWITPPRLPRRGEGRERAVVEFPLRDRCARLYDLAATNLPCGFPLRRPSDRSTATVGNPARSFRSTVRDVPRLPFLPSLTLRDRRASTNSNEQQMPKSYKRANQLAMRYRTKSQATGKESLRTGGWVGGWVWWHFHHPARPKPLPRKEHPAIHTNTTAAACPIGATASRSLTSPPKTNGRFKEKNHAPRTTRRKTHDYGDATYAPLITVLALDFNHLDRNTISRIRNHT